MSQLLSWVFEQLGSAHCYRKTTARDSPDFLGVSQNRVISFYPRLRVMFAEDLDKTNPLIREIEVDDGYLRNVE